MTSYDSNRAQFILPSSRSYSPPPDFQEPSAPTKPMSSPLISGSSPPPLTSTVPSSSASSSAQPNWPPCKPVIHHDISLDIQQEYRLFVRQSYVAWWFHSFAIIWNFVCLCALLVTSATLIGFFLALLYLFLSPGCAFCPYWSVYTAIKDHSSFRWTLWTCLQVFNIAFEIVLALGIDSTGGAGLINGFSALSSNNKTIGTMLLVSAAAWIIILLFNVYLFYKGRKVYNEMGANSKAALSEFSRGVVTTAYDNRETIGQVVRENQDTIKQVVLENKDTIGQIASENKDVLIKAAWENRDTLAQNKDVVDNVFGGNTKSDQNPFG